ncbi:MAG: hypothetical protein C0483_16460 [Pirellula sp.]|nr:hypothetical protein [Pirellula sp.]
MDVVRTGRWTVRVLTSISRWTTIAIYRQRGGISFARRDEVRILASASHIAASRNGSTAHENVCWARQNARIEHSRA